MAIASIDQFGVLIPNAYDDFGGGNHFHPMPLSPEGIFYQDDAIRNWDVGETPDSILFWNWYFKWDKVPADYRDVDNVVWRIDAAARNLDLKGGTAYPFVVVADVVNGQSVPSSGRYYLQSKPLTLGTFASPHVNQFTVPSSSGWVCTFSRAGNISAMPASPDLRYVEAIGCVIHGASSLPTGDIGLKLFQID